MIQANTGQWEVYKGGNWDKRKEILLKVLKEKCPST